VASQRSQQYRSARPAGHDGHGDSRFDEQGGTRLFGSIGSGRHHAHHHHRITLVLYPNMGASRWFVVSRQGHTMILDEDEKTVPGRLYIVGGKGESYEAVGGPPGKPQKGGGGHTAGQTPSGLFTLGPKLHHTTLGWPLSTIPYGAPLRFDSHGFVEYFEHHVWKNANGPHGIWTKASKDFHARDGDPPVVNESDLALFHKAAYRKDNKLRPTWIMNDFGEWSWNLMHHGKRTPYYMHTTPQDEAYMRLPLERDSITVLFGHSHGCVHILPQDRDEMIHRGYLKEGVHVRIMPYSQKGPPEGWVAATAHIKT
jgi:hypothetical protein